MQQCSFLLHLYYAMLSKLYPQCFSYPQVSEDCICVCQSIAYGECTTIGLHIVTRFVIVLCHNLRVKMASF